MQKNKKSAALILLSVVLSGAAFSAIGYFIYRKWLVEGEGFLFARDYSGVALTSAVTVILIFEVIFIAVTVHDRSDFNRLNNENEALHAKYKKVCQRLKNAEKDVDNLKAVQNAMLNREQNDNECSEEKWNKALDKIAESQDEIAELQDEIAESQDEIAESQLEPVESEMDSSEAIVEAILHSESMKESNRHNIEEAEPEQTDNTEEAEPEQTDNTEEAEPEQTGNTEETESEQTDNTEEAEPEQIDNTEETEPEQIAENQDRVIKNTAVIRDMLSKIDSDKQYPTTLLNIKLSGVSVDEYYSNMKNLFRRRAVWTSPKEDQLLLIFVKEKQKNIMDFVWQHIVYQKEVKTYDFFNVDEKNTVSKLLEDEKIMKNLISQGDYKE